MAINNIMQAVGTFAAAKSLLSTNNSKGPSGKYGDFIAEIRKDSVARTAYFEVTITAPRILAGDGRARKLSLYAKAAQLPGLFLDMGPQVKRYGVGPNESLPYSLHTNDLTFTFIGDGKGEIYKFFYSWMQGIVPADIRAGSFDTNANGSQFYEVEFKEQYKTEVTITLYNEQNEKILSYDLWDAFPVSLPDVSLSWNDTDQMMEFPVMFTFLQSKLDTESLQSGEGKLRKPSLFEKAVKIGNAIQVLSTLRKPSSIGDALNVAGNAKRVLTGLKSNL